MKQLFIAVLLFFIGVASFQIYKVYDQQLRGVLPAEKNPPADIAMEIQEESRVPLHLPEGFSVSIFAKDLVSPRVLLRDPGGNILVSIPSKGKVVALPDADRDGQADDVITVIDELNRPHGLAFFDDTLYIAETDGVATYDYDQVTLKATKKRKIVDLPGGGNHFTRTIGIGPDGKLYISVGSSCNVCVEKDWRRAKILVADPDGKNLKEFASGLRNSVFFTWHPQTKEMWASEMGRDLLGDDIPPDEINIIKDGGNYGWPDCYGKNIQDKTFSKKICDQAQPSTIDLQAHSAPLGLAFYQGDILVSYHGSWNRPEPTGYKIVRIKLDDQGKYLGTEDFITGWLTDEGVPGRPADILMNPDGTMYVSDDKAGVIYRITYSP